MCINSPLFSKSSAKGKKCFIQKRYKFTWGIKGYPNPLHLAYSTPKRASHPCCGWEHPQPNHLCLPDFYLYYYPKRELVFRIMILKNCRALDHQRKIPALDLLRKEQSRELEFCYTWILYVHKGSVEFREEPPSIIPDCHGCLQKNTRCPHWETVSDFPLQDLQMQLN